MCELFYGGSSSEDGTSPGGTHKPPRKIPIGSVKSLMGHAEGGSGLASVCKCLIMLEKEELFPHGNFVETKHECLLDGRFEVVSERRKWKPRQNAKNLCVSNYGFGGTNAFAVLGPGNVDFTTSAVNAMWSGG